MLCAECSAVSFFLLSICLQEVLDAADVELGFNYPFPIVTQEVKQRQGLAIAGTLLFAARIWHVLCCDDCNDQCNEK
jgi:hypothetical protein